MFSSTKFLKSSYTKKRNSRRRLLTKAPKGAHRRLTAVAKKPAQPRHRHAKKIPASVLSAALAARNPPAFIGPVFTATDALHEIEVKFGTNTTSKGFEEDIVEPLMRHLESKDIELVNMTDGYSGGDGVHSGYVEILAINAGNSAIDE